MAEQRGTRTNPEVLTKYWYEALGEEIGLFIRCTHRQKFVNALYQARDGADDPQLSALMIFQPEKDIVFIAKKAVEMPKDA